MRVVVAYAYKHKDESIHEGNILNYYHNRVYYHLELQPRLFALEDIFYAYNMTSV